MCVCTWAAVSVVLVWFVTVRIVAVVHVRLVCMACRSQL